MFNEQITKESASIDVECSPLDVFQNALPLAPSATGVNRSTDQVSQAMQSYVDAGRITSEDHATLVWFFHHCKVEKKYTSFDDFGKIIDYSGSTISRIFAGKYVGDMGEVVKIVSSYRHINAERQKMAGDIFVETSIWSKVKGVCDLAITHHAPVRIIGVSQIGKTHALMEYKRRAQCTVFYARVPAAPTFRNFQDMLASSVGLPTSLRSEEMRIRVPRALNEQTLLVIDELHELALSAGRSTAMKCMEWLREVWDTSHCGLAVCGTRSMEDDLINGAGLKGWLDQFDQRCIRRLILPNKLPIDDIAKTAEAYGFPTPRASESNILSSMRMNRLCTCFKLASMLARNRAKKGGSSYPTWDDFVASYQHNFGKEI